MIDHKQSVFIDGVEYVPKGDIPPLTNERLQNALESLTEILYHDHYKHKHRAWAWNAMNFLAPELAKLPPDVAYKRLHGTD